MLDNLLSGVEGYREKQEQRKEELKEFNDRMRRVANRLFSTEDGKELARQMIRACHLLEAEPRVLPSDELRNLQAQKDFVNMFVTRLVDREVFIGIIEGI